RAGVRLQEGHAAGLSLEGSAITFAGGVLTLRRPYRMAHRFKISLSDPQTSVLLLGYDSWELPAGHHFRVYWTLQDSGKDPSGLRRRSAHGDTTLCLAARLRVVPGLSGCRDCGRANPPQRVRPAIELFLTGEGNFPVAGAAVGAAGLPSC